MKYPIGLPVRCKDNVTRIIKEPYENIIGYYMCIDPTNGYGKAIHQSWLTPLTEAEYFEEVMKPEGWEKDITGWHYFDYEDEEDGTVIIDYDAGVFLETETPSITKSVHKLLGCALDHYEALQAIRKFEQE